MHDINCYSWEINLYKLLSGVYSTGNFCDRSEANLIQKKIIMSIFTIKR